MTDFCFLPPSDLGLIQPCRRGVFHISGSCRQCSAVQWCPLGTAQSAWRCPVCLALQGKRVRLSCVHVLLSCSGVQAIRDKTGITEFITGLSSLASYRAFLNGKEAASQPLP